MPVVVRTLLAQAATSPENPQTETVNILDCVDLGPTPGGAGRRGAAFFAVGPDAEDVAGLIKGGKRACRSVGGGVIAVAPLDGAGQFPLSNGRKAAVSPAEPGLFAGLNCAVSERNGETAHTLFRWLLWHAETQGLQGALILDRSRPDAARDFAAALEKLLEAEPAAADLQVVVLSAAIPLGKSGLGPESHPFLAPDAPGKDRMKPPAEDPWAAPFAAGNFYELARVRFLSAARAVINIDVYDILPGDDGPNVFDAAVSAEGGVVTLEGERVYPWAIRKNHEAAFSDHACHRFDSNQRHLRWAIAPKSAPSAVWRYVRIGGVQPEPQALPFYRCMALRFRAEGADSGKVSRIVPKSSLVESKPLLELAVALGGKPVRMPEARARKTEKGRNHLAIVTTMKNEGPFILEWLAYHRAIGVKDFLVYTNDCDDGTDTMLSLLQDKGYLQHRDNPYRESGMKPQHAALGAAENEEVIRNAGWLICMDVDEYINIHTGDGTLKALFDAVPDANMISCTWRLFGNADVAEFRDELITERFTLCAHEMTRKPHQAWGFKTMFRNSGLFKKLGVHRPKGLRPQLVDQINWVNGSGQRMPRDEYRNAWRSTARTVGYDLVTLNHYAVRSAESFLVKRDRGRVNHVDRDQGVAYWFRMNNNAEQDLSIQRMLPALRKEYEKLLSDPDIAAAHAHSVTRHRTRIDELKQGSRYRDFYADLIGARLRGLSRLHAHFGSSVFLAGPECIPDDYLDRDLTKDDPLIVPKVKTQH